MAYTLNINSIASATIDAGAFSIGKNASIQVSSSNAIQSNVSLQTGSWTAISLGTLSNVAYISLYNDNTVNTASIIQVATGSTGGNVIATIQPGLPALIAWSGSLNGLYGTVTGASQGNVGVLQYYAQQA